VLITPATPGADRVVVTLDGEDITNDCTAASPDLGFVELLVRDKDGKYVVDGERGIQQERRYGIVAIATKPRAA
jgi:hypothetical protein